MLISKNALINYFFNVYKQNLNKQIFLKNHVSKPQTEEMQRKRCDHVLADKDTEGRVGQVTDVHLHRQPHIHQHVPCASLQQPLVFLRHACSALLVIPSHSLYSLCFSIRDKIWISARPPQHLFPQIYSHLPLPPIFFLLLLVQYEDIIAGLKCVFCGGFLL